MKKIVKVLISGGVAAIGLLSTALLSAPPGETPVAVLAHPVLAGHPITSTDLATETVPIQWAKAAQLQTKAEAVGFVPQTDLPAGVPIPWGDRLNTTIRYGDVALPLSISQGSAEGVGVNTRIAIYTPSQTGSGQLDASGVRVLAVDAPPGASSPQQTEIVVIEAPMKAAEAIVGETLVLAPMGGHPSAIWYVGGAATTTEPSSTTGARLTASSPKS